MTMHHAICKVMNVGGKDRNVYRPARILPCATREYWVKVVVHNNMDERSRVR